jgi:Flp pilus assembly protein TadG
MGGATLSRRAAGLVSDRGAAAVEMALVLPLLLLLVFGIIDFGRMLNAQITLTEAAREGARASVLGANPGNAVSAASTNLSGVTYTQTACPANPTAGQNATVTTTYTFKFVTPVGAIAGIFGGTFGGDLPMTGVGVMPCNA